MTHESSETGRNVLKIPKIWVWWLLGFFRAFSPPIFRQKPQDFSAQCETSVN